MYTKYNTAQLSSDLNTPASTGAARVITDYIKYQVKANSQLRGEPFMHY